MSRRRIGVHPVVHAGVNDAISLAKRDYVSAADVAVCWGCESDDAAIQQAIAANGALLQGTRHNLSALRKTVGPHD